MKALVTLALGWGLLRFLRSGLSGYGGLLDGFGD